MIRRLSAYISLAPVRNMVIKYAVTVLLFALSCVASAQGVVVEDTVNISAITVTAAAPERLLPYSVSVIGQASLVNSGESDLAGLLHAASLVTVKRYGNYGLASVSVRGLPGSHTQVIWNGLPVNSASNGYSDFAIIPLNAASSVRLTSGGYDLNDITGSIGGKIDLSSELFFGKSAEGSLSLSGGSYDSYSVSATAEAGGESLAARIGIWGARAVNDFRFINADSPGGATEERRTNASASSEGLTGDLGFRSGKSILSAHFWYNNARRELPGPVTTVQQDYGEKQNDRSVRGIVRYDLDPGRLKFSVSAGGSHETNLYFNEFPELNGDNRSSMFVISSRLSYRPGSKTELVLNAGNEYDNVHTLSYSGTHDRNVFSASLSARFDPLAKLRLTVQARQMITGGLTPSPEFTAGAVWKITGDGKHLLKTSLSHNIKLPCLNDMYWVPGGNSSLRPEQANEGEASYSYAAQASSGLKNTLTLTLHAARITDMIQWVPGDGGLWTAQNVTSVNVRGLEGMIGSQIPLNEWNLSGYVNYFLTRSVVAASETPDDISKGSQLIYAPLHHLNLNVSTGWKMIRAQLTGVYESRRFISADNSEWLPSSLIADGSIGAVLVREKTKLRLDFDVRNIFNSRIESVRYYPMPLRTYNIRLTLNVSNLPAD